MRAGAAPGRGARPDRQRRPRPDRRQRRPDRRASRSMHELNIGHSIVARALFVGLEAAVREMKAAMVAARECGPA